MSNISITVSEDIRKMLDEYVHKTNFTKTEVMVRALTKYLGVNDELVFSQRLSKMERRLSEIEKLIKK